MNNIESLEITEVPSRDTILPYHNKLVRDLGIAAPVSDYEKAKIFARSTEELLPYLRGATISLFFNGKEFDGPEGLKRCDEIIDLIPKDFYLRIIGPVPYSYVRENLFVTNEAGTNFQFMKMRQISVNPIREKKYWYIVDDDMEFRGPTLNNNQSAGLQVLRSLVYMDKHPNCGCIRGGSTMIRKLSKTQLGPGPSLGSLMHGALIRNINNGNLAKYSEEALATAGGGEDTIIWIDRISQGYYSAVYPAFRTIHRCSKVEFDEDDPNELGVHSLNIRNHPITGCDTYIRKYYNFDIDLHIDSINSNMNKMRRYMLDRSGVYTYQPDYIEDMSYVE